MKEDKLVERLEKCCTDMELISELTFKYRDLSVVSQKLLNKDIEDGILAKLGTANLYQLRMMKDSYRFRYYSKDVTDKLIDAAIVKVSRKEKLKKIDRV